MARLANLGNLVAPIRDDLTSGAAEIALQGVSTIRNLLSSAGAYKASEVKEMLGELVKELINAQPAMAPLFNVGNSILLAVDECNSVDEIIVKCDQVLDEFERRLCESASKIAELTFDLIPPGDLVFAYSFSSTVASSFLYARATRKKFFRAVCTESRPSMEGRKLADMLAASGLEVIHTFDSAMGLILPNCRAAFMGVDAIARPGIVNKAGSWILAVACRELGIPLYALSGTEKFVDDERLFAFEDSERPGSEVWSDPPKGVRVLNKQFELIPFSWISGLVTEDGILKEGDIGRYVDKLQVHESLKLESTF